VTEDRDGDRIVHLIAPEGADLVFALATVGERAIAFAVDFVISQLISILFVLTALAFTVITTSEHILALAIVGWFIIRQGYFLFFEARMHGSTPAKRLLGLRVVSRDGAKLSIESIVARSLLRDLELFVPLMVGAAPEQFLGPSPWWLRVPALLWVLLLLSLPFLTRERTRAGDMVAGTIVVRVPKVQLARDEAEGMRARIRFTKEQLAIYGEHELETLAELLRKLDVGKASDDDLRVVAEAIARRIRFEGREPAQQPGLFLRTFYREQRTELERELVLGRRIADKNERKDRQKGARP
jgi:uncharacterized RDD family membrane protein YckC